MRPRLHNISNVGTVKVAESIPLAIEVDVLSCRRRNRRQAAASAGDPHADNALHKRQRAAVFCDWLVDKYGAEYLTSGSGVS